MYSEVKKKVIQKTAYQRESARLMQRERRRAKRLAKVSQRQEGCTNQPGDPEEGTEDVRLDFSDTEFSMLLVLLFVIYDAESLQVRERILPEHAKVVQKYKCRKLVEGYMRQSGEAPKSVEAIETHLDFIRCEISSLQDQQAKIPSAEIHHRNKLEQMTQSQAQQVRQSDLEIGLIGEATLQYRMATHAKAVLPKMLAQRKNARKKLEHKLSKARAKARKEVDLEKLRDQRRNLEDEVRQYDSVLSTAFPSSAARTDFLDMRKLAQRELAEFDLTYPTLSALTSA